MSNFSKVTVKVTVELHKTHGDGRSIAKMSDFAIKEMIREDNTFFLAAGIMEIIRE